MPAPGSVGQFQDRPKIFRGGVQVCGPEDFRPNLRKALLFCHTRRREFVGREEKGIADLRTGESKRGGGVGFWRHLKWCRQRGIPRLEACLPG